MSRQKRLWASRKHKELIELLGGRCQDPECTTPERPLEIDHPNGREYDIAPMARDKVVSLYWREHQEGIPLRVLCNHCNKLGRNQPRRKRDPDQGPF